MNREQILAKRDKKPVEIVTAELGQGFIRRMTPAQAQEWSDFRDAVVDDKGNIADVPTFHAKLVQLSYCDDKCELIFTINDVAAIRNSLDYATIAQIFVESCRVNCLTRGDSVAEVAEARRNFYATGKTSTGIGSAVTSANTKSAG